MRPYFNRYRVEWVVLNNGSGPTAAAGPAADGWAAAHVDDHFFVMARHTPETADLIRREAIATSSCGRTRR